ncbi:MAG TPA: sensor histidine kinase [Streptosporangiaceae bacterium]
MTDPDLPARTAVRPGVLPHATAGRRWAVDVTIAAAVTAVQVGVTHASTAWESHGGHPAPGILTYVLLAVGGASLIGRRRYPVAVLAVTLTTALWAGVPGHSGVVWLALIVAFFNAVLERKRAAAIASLVIGYVASMWPLWLIGQRGHPSAAAAIWLAVLMLFMLSIAEIIRSRSQRKAALEQSRSEELRRRAGEERMRMARDLHDVVAHNISVINVQANTALHLMDRQPERARTALTNINEVSKQALVELRSVLGVLRDVDDPAPLKPSPGLAHLGDLVNNAATAGLTVRVLEEGQPGPLPADVDLAAYRIVQEALTNSARHSGSEHATVRVTYGADALVVEINDQGALPPPGRPPVQANGSGNGITGMTERATVLGGTLRAGRRPEGGFEVRAWLPMPWVER